MSDESQTENTADNTKSERAPQLKPYHWKPGQSGNPGGRPKKKPITEMFEQMLATDEDFGEIRDAIKKVFLEKSGMAKVMLLKDMAERLEGKVVQPIEADVTLSTLAERMEKARERAEKGNG